MFKGRNIYLEVIALIILLNSAFTSTGIFPGVANEGCYARQMPLDYGPSTGSLLLLSPSKSAALGREKGLALSSCYFKRLIKMSGGRGYQKDDKITYLSIPLTTAPEESGIAITAFQHYGGKH
ncbi:regulator of G-protein signaling 7-binding protein [Platysternon megacephalum]|uniref:Regulator of G-protein signaling 7-binding protein n=1 Tax=Platysternon megacephalum TaxID=55544 RepID=A0A4D9EYD0_9SAUR|nr:regulator of G-protein signaling 7-binding protein [Platysternon megacephalum]